MKGTIMSMQNIKKIQNFTGKPLHCLSRNNELIAVRMSEEAILQEQKRLLQKNPDDNLVVGTVSVS